MKFKLIMALVDDNKTDEILKAARQTGCTGATVITSARGEGLVPQKTFLGLNLAGQRDILLFLVEEHMSRRVLESIARVGRFDEEPGSGIALQLSVDDAVGLETQLKAIAAEIENDL